MVTSSPRLLIGFLVALLGFPLWSQCQFSSTIQTTTNVWGASSNQCLVSDPDKDKYSCTGEDGSGGDAASISAIGGVKQRIDGSESEKEAIMKVMLKMQEYLREEVTVKPEYKGVRDSCMNKKDLCAFWAAVGECTNSRDFMMNACALACRYCLAAKTNFI